MLLYLAFIAVFLVLWGVFYAMLPALRHAGHLTAHLSTKASLRYARYDQFTKRYTPYFPIVLVVAVGGFLAAWAGHAFLDLAELVHAKSEPLQEFDVMSHAWAVAHRTRGATDLFTVMTIIGGPEGVGIIAFAVAVWLLIKHRYRWVIYLMVTIGGGALLNLELKHYFARQRPAVAEMLRRAQGYSFPSGHAMGSTVVFGALSYLAFRTAVQWRWKSASLAAAMTLILAVAISRVYLGAHWLSDVGAGITAGTVWVGSTTVAYETLRRIRRLRHVARAPSPPGRPGAAAPH